MDPDHRGLPVLTFSEHSVPAEHAFDVYHDATAPLFDTGLLDDAVVFRAEATDYLVDDVVVSRVGAGPHTLRRTSRHMRDGTTDWVTVQIHHRGGLRGEAGRDTSLGLGPTQIGIVDLAEPFALWSPGGVATWVGLPRERIAHADRLGPARALDRSSPEGRVLDAAIRDLWRRLGDARADDAGDIAAGIAETVNSVLDPDRFTPTDHDLGLAMEDYVKANLGDLDVDVDRLRSAFHCSRSSVYRCFERRGGVASFIREQRLLQCFDELTRPSERPRRVSEVAIRWGFENPSHFNRLFKAKFGLPPSALSVPARLRDEREERPTSTTEQIRQFHTWAGAR